MQDLYKELIQLLEQDVRQLIIDMVLSIIQQVLMKQIHIVKVI